MCRAIPYWVVEWARQGETLLLAVQLEKERHKNTKARLKKKELYVKTLKDEIKLLKRG